MEKATFNNLVISSRHNFFRYIVQIKRSKTLLWCYVIWYLVMLSLYFVADPAMWLNSAGLALIVGYALVLSTGGNAFIRLQTTFWATSRLFLCPFLVSSFTAITNKRDFTLIFSPSWQENLLAFSLCSLLAVLILVAKRSERQQGQC